MLIFDVLDGVKECSVIATMPRKPLTPFRKVLLQRWPPVNIILCPDKEKVGNEL